MIFTYFGNRAWNFDERTLSQQGYPTVANSLTDSHLINNKAVSPPSVANMDRVSACTVYVTPANGTDQSGRVYQSDGPSKLY